jgi:cholesterol transport system auxiliary component
MKIVTSICCAVGLLCGCSSGPSWKGRTFAFSVPVDPPSTSVATNVVALNRVSISPVFQTRSFTYRTGENSYEQDPYAGFVIPPERALAESIRAWMRAGGAFGRVVDPGSGLTANLFADVFINELYGDFRNASQPVGRMELHFVCYEIEDGASRRVVLDRVCARETPLAKKTVDALMAAWDADLREIMEEINSEYTKVNNIR